MHVGDPVAAVDYDDELGVVVVRTEATTDFERKLRKKTLTSGCAQGTAFGDLLEDFEAARLPEAGQPEDRLALTRSQANSNDLIAAEKTLLSLKESEAAGLPPEELIFAGQGMAEVWRLVSEVADTPTTVLISGESGTGKEMVARALHERLSASFVPGPVLGPMLRELAGRDVDMRTEHPFGFALRRVRHDAAHRMNPHPVAVAVTHARFAFVERQLTRHMGMEK